MLASGTWSRRAYMVGTVNRTVGRSAPIISNARSAGIRSGTRTEAAPTRAGK